jgi:hypothetical protein
MAAAATSTAMKLPFGTPKVDDGIWIVSFMHNDLGFIDVEQKALQPFGTELSPISQVLPLPMSPVRTIRPRPGRGDRRRGLDLLRAGGNRSPSASPPNNWPPTFGADLRIAGGQPAAELRAVFHRGRLFLIDAIGRRL